MEPASDLSDVLDALPMRGALLRVPAICVMLMFIEGIDTFGIGFVAPFLSKAMDLTATQMGYVFTGSVFASLVGATLLAPLATRFGRWVVLATAATMVPMTLLTAHAPNLATLFVVRFVIGVAFGGALPMAAALVADYAPSRRKASLQMLLNAGIGGGMVLAGYSAAILIPALGWRAMLYASALASLAIFVAAWAFLPESVPFLLRKNRQDEARAILGKVGRGPVPVLRLEESAGKPQDASPRALARDGRHVATLLLLALTSISYVTVNLVAYWLPTILVGHDIGIDRAGAVISTGKLGGLGAILVVGWLADRFGLARTATANFVATGALVLAIAASPALGISAALLIAALALDGGNVSAIQAIIATSFPSSLRATGFGWITGFARLLGGGLGTMLGARIADWHWALSSLALLMGVTYFGNALIVQALKVTAARRPVASLA